jgi:hypothetical protein
VAQSGWWNGALAAEPLVFSTAPALASSGMACAPEWGIGFQAGDIHRTDVNTGVGTPRVRSLRLSFAPFLHQVAAQLCANEPVVLERDTTIQQLFDIYEREMTPGTSRSKQAHDRRCGEMFRRYFGSKRKTSTLSILDWNRFIRDRRAGKIGPRPGANDPAGPRQILYDLKHLRAVLNWAMLSRVDGQVPLDKNPLACLPLPKEPNPNRPVMKQDYYERLLEVAPEVDWRFHLALLLVHETGHRITSVRCLRWEDIDLQQEVIVRNQPTPPTDTSGPIVATGNAG